MNPVLLVDEAIGCALHDQQKQYLEVHRNRYVYTLQALSKCLPVNKFLEIGSTAFFQQLVRAVSPLTEVYGTQFAAEPSFMESVAPFKGWGSFKYYLGNPELFQYIIKEESFDLVLCAEVIEHMAVDPMALLVEMNRVLSIGGQLVLTTPNVVGSRSILAALEQRMPFNFYAYNKNKSSDRHNIEYSPHLLSRIIELAGFRISELSTENCWSSPDPRLDEIYTNYGFDSSLRGDDIFIIAEKVGAVVQRYPSDLYV